MVHYDLTPQQRTQIDGRWHNVRAPLCSTGDGHYVGHAGDGARITCPECIRKQALVAPRERHRVQWGDGIVGREVTTRFLRRHEWSEGQHYPGEVLTMSDGTRWFHPYDGSAPVQLEGEQS